MHGLMASLFNVTHFHFIKKRLGRLMHHCASSVNLGEYKMRTTFLDIHYSQVNLLIEELKESWTRTSCSIVMDGWISITHQPLINIIVSCWASHYFLRAIDCSGKKKDVNFQFQLLKDAIEEIGASNVVRIVTDSIAVCRLAKKMVQQYYKHIFWNSCVHALKNIGKIE